MEQKANIISSKIESANDIDSNSQILDLDSQFKASELSRKNQKEDAKHKHEQRIQLVHNIISIITYSLLNVIFWVFLCSATFYILYPLFKGEVDADRITKVISLSISWTAGFLMNYFRENMKK
jgi:hypothetical protein